MILLASAKTMKQSDITDGTIPIFNEKSLQIRHKISKLSKEQLAKYFKIKGKTLDNTYSYYQTSIKGKVITSLDGAVFKQIENSNPDYVTSNLYVLDAMYGILNGNDIIDLFRLDFNLKSVLAQSYYYYWRDDVHNFISSSKHQQILLLTSDEYTKLLKLSKLDKQVYTVDFNKLIKSSVHKKQIRGMIANYCISNQILEYNSLNGVVIGDYTLTILNDTVQVNPN